MANHFISDTSEPLLEKDRSTKVRRLEIHTHTHTHTQKKEPTRSLPEVSGALIQRLTDGPTDDTSALYVELEP